ncbi:ABC-F family ATP-binding cassette domain-containing protein [Phnomibacter sp. MR]|uniref:ABC-F family ATP-binding cassette domain-containing protein n=1 Tax=Phnomibacter sp. MR TaxID=3042318 RepID=UPI003A80B2C7
MLAGFNNVTFEFGARVIVSDATWHIQPNERIGLIGYNGTGKSTLLRLLVGEYTCSAGTVERGKNVQIGFLHQDLLSTEIEKPVLEVAMDAFTEARRLEAELRKMEKQLETDHSNEELLHQYADMLHDFELAGGYTMQHQSEEVLHGLGFETDQFEKPFNQFSGGWRMRVLLAKLILQKPEILLLDEPTNHLDLPSIEWLEKYLQHYPGSVVIVSHDKYFMNRMVNKVVELYQQQLHMYTGNFDFYEREKAERIALQKRAFENQQDYIRQQERFIERFKAKASKAAQAQSVAKRLDKLDRIEDVEIERPNIRINFMVGQQPGRTICTLKHVSKAYGDVEILRNTSAEIFRGDKVALIGANGKGKSTLLRIIAGSEKIEGDRIWGHNVQEAFYAQHQLESLNVNHTVLEEMTTSRAGKTELEYRALLGCFLFSGDDTEKKIKVLSGGEKARVALAKTIVSKANFLMLDEPTNHLDMHSVELLIEALNKYEGSLIIVSHDRYFISRTANVFWEIINHEIREFRGTYEEYLEWKEKLLAQEAAAKQEQMAPEPVVVKAVQPKPQPVNRELQKEYQKQQKAFEKQEQQLQQLQAKMQEVEGRMADPAVYADKQQFLQAEKDYSTVKQQLDAAQQQYEKAFEALMEMEEQLKG